MQPAKRIVNWLHDDVDKLIRYNEENERFSLAMKIYDVSRPVLMTERVVYISEKDLVQIFLLVQLHEEDKRLEASIMHIDKETNEFIERTKVDGQRAKKMIASFFCDFPEAVMSVDQGVVVWLIVEEHNQKMWLSLENLWHAHKGGATKFFVAVPAPRQG